METNVNYTLVGTFVIALTTAIILAIIWLSSGFSFERYTTYLAYMQESVSGLSEDSQVEYNGVAVGTVKSIQLNHKNPQLVEVFLNIKNATPITRGTVATLTTRGLTGLVYVALKDKSTDLRPLERQPGQPYPVIPTAPSIFVRLETFLVTLSADFQKISQAFENLLDQENLKSIKETLVNMDRVTGTLAANSQRLSAILQNTEKASLEFTPLLQNSRGAMRMLETQTLPTAYQALSNLNDVARTLSDVSKQLKENPSVLIRGKTPSTPGPGESK